MAFFNRRVDPRIPDTVEWDTQIVEGATVAEFSELPARYGIRTTQIFNPDAVACEIADDEYSPFTALTRIYTGSPTASEYYADGGSAYIFLHADNLGKYARASIYPGGTVITAERLASDEFKGATGATGPTGATGATGATGPAGPAMDAAINAASDKTTPADADRIGFTDSADSYNLKRFTFANLFTWIVSKVFALTSKTTPVDADGFLITDSAASNVGKWLSWTNLKATLKNYFDSLYIKPQCEWRADTHAGYGSTDTKIPYFTNVRVNVDTASAIAVTNNSTNGCKVLINTADYYTFSYNASPAVASYIGFSLNSAQLTTTVDGINVQNRLALTYIVGTETARISIRLWCAVNDVVRVHTSGVAPYDAAFSNFSVTRG